MRVGGGLSTSPEDAHPLEDFVPAERLLPTLEAVVRVFDRTGNRENKSRARLKYVIRKLGMEGFREEYQAELAKLGDEAAVRRRSSGPTPCCAAGAARAGGAAAEGFAEWRRTNCLAQRQAGHFACIVGWSAATSPARQLRGAGARLARRFSATARSAPPTTRTCSCAGCPRPACTALHAALLALGLGRPGARTIEDVTRAPAPTPATWR